jgi:dTDP-4-dehydrorhamnose 3,5-epimerase
VADEEAVVETAISGVFLVPITSFPDDRGAFSEVYRREWIPNGPEMVQANISRSRQGVLRGLHFHREQSDYWLLLSGVEFVGLYDLRPGSPSEGTKLEILLDLEEGPRRGLFIPPGVAHGFFAKTEVELLYLVDRYFTGEDERGVAWDDPDVGIEWPSRDPILSDRDRSNPSLATVRESSANPRPG